MDEEELYQILSFVRRSEHRTKILKFLDEQEDAKTPTDIAETQSVHRNHVSNQLGKLKEKDLVIVINPDAAHHRYYQITEKGEEIADKL